MNNRTLKGAIFDLDGTILDSSWVWEKIDREFLGGRGIDVPEDYVENIAPLGFYGAAVYTIDRFGFEDKPEELMKIWGEMAIREYKNNVYIKEGVAEYLDYLYTKGIPMGIATASNEDLFIPCLEHNNIFKYFQTFTTVSEVGISKESADVYIATARKLGIYPDECVVFEDLPQGLISASNAGFYTVAIPDDFSKNGLKRFELDVDCICHSFIGENIRKIFD